VPPNDRSNAPLIAVEGLGVRFRGAPAEVVAGVSFDLRRGETLCLVGESGCGKSVTALALMGLLQAGSAEIRAARLDFDGTDLRALGPHRMADLRGDRLAMIFQEPMTSLNPVFTIGEQIAEAIRRHRGTDKAIARRRAAEMLGRVGIPAAGKRLDDYPHQLSGGMRQRVMIAMALANDPAVLIADEPTTALDTTIQAQILDLIRRLQEETGTAVLLITHDLGVVAEVADQVAVMYAGKIVEAGPAAAVFDDPQHPYTIGLMSSLPALALPRRRLTTIPGLVPTVDTMPAGCRFSTRCPFATRACAQEPPLATITPGHDVACHFVPIETRLDAAG
jgi:oligopeptide/dipeptide ABC transporter ATP-binding protein